MERPSKYEYLQWWSGFVFFRKMPNNGKRSRAPRRTAITAAAAAATSDAVSRTRRGRR